MQYNTTVIKSFYSRRYPKLSDIEQSAAALLTTWQFVSKGGGVISRIYCLEESGQNCNKYGENGAPSNAILDTDMLLRFEIMAAQRRIRSRIKCTLFDPPPVIIRKGVIGENTE